LLPVSAITADYGYELGVITDDSEWKMLVPISESEYKATSAALMAIARLDPPFHYGLIERNYQDLQARHQFVTIVLSLGSQFADPNRGTQLGESLSTSIVNWLHCGPPLSQLYLARGDGSNPQTKPSVRQLVKRDELLANFDGWGAIVKKDLQKFPETFEVLPLIASAMDGIRDVQRACAEIALDDAVSKPAVLVGVLERIKSTGAEGHPAVFRYRRDTLTHVEISPSLILAESVRILQSVASGDTDRETLWATPAKPEPLPLDPETIRKQFHRGSRGVQALATWMTEGGGTPKFSATVNSIIVEDRNIEPLITGLINVSGLLANVAAGAIGTSREGVVGGLLDIYGPFDQPMPPDSGSKQESRPRQ